MKNNTQQIISLLLTLISLAACAAEPSTINPRAVTISSETISSYCTPATLPPSETLSSYPPPVIPLSTVTNSSYPPPATSQPSPSEQPARPIPTLTPYLPTLTRTLYPTEPTPTLMPPTIRLDNLKLFDAKTGWALKTFYTPTGGGYPPIIDQILLRTTDGFQGWRDVSPQSLPEETQIYTIFFVDENTTVGIFTRNNLPEKAGNACPSPFNLQPLIWKNKPEWGFLSLKSASLSFGPGMME